jgi:diguanylate cyclase (GGDEF)-like protein
VDHQVKKSFRHIRIMVTVLILLIALSAYFILYMPMRDAVRQLMLDNFVIASNAIADNVTTIIDRCREGATTISSRTMLKRNMLAFREGRITWEELASYHHGRYSEGTGALAHLTGAMRIMDGRVLVAVGTTSEQSHDVEEHFRNRVLRFDFDQPRDPGSKQHDRCAMSLTVQSPIKESGLLLGHDYVCFDLCRAFSELQTRDIHFTIVPAGEANRLREETETSFALGSPDLYRTATDIGLLRFLPDADAAVLVSTEYASLFAISTRLAFTNLFPFLGVLIVLVVGSNIFIVVVLHRLLRDLQCSRDVYKKHSLQDALTGLLSRRGLEGWVANDLSRESATFTVVMLDLDRFKELNDNFGHKQGDAALKELARIIDRTLRADDLAVRYGGDEFLLVLRRTNAAAAAGVVQRLESSLSRRSFHGQGLHISWGLSEADEQRPVTRDMFDAMVRKADENMYRMKQKRKNNQKPISQG